MVGFALINSPAIHQQLQSFQLEPRLGKALVFIGSDICEQSVTVLIWNSTKGPRAPLLPGAFLLVLFLRKKEPSFRSAECEIFFFSCMGLRLLAVEAFIWVPWDSCFENRPCLLNPWGIQGNSYNLQTRQLSTGLSPTKKWMEPSVRNSLILNIRSWRLLKKNKLWGF